MLYRENKPGLLLCLDFEKAFDSVDWKFMFKVLRAFGFGPDICQWISTFYKDIKSSVAVNGELSQWFAIKRGCGQGDPISPYLFILCIEILAIMIRQNKHIKSIFIGETELFFFSRNMQMILKLCWKVTKIHLKKQLRPSTHSEKHQVSS